MYQLPVRAKIIDPANLGTADCALICHCDDGHDYAVKNKSSGRYVCHSEWFCKHLGDMVGIPSPECRKVEVDGEVAFGSRWESGHDPNNWVDRIRRGAIEKSRVAPTISRIFAFDLFVNNHDRHTTNYIVRPQVGGSWSFLAFDYSKAWRAIGWPIGSSLMDPHIATRRNMTIINSLVGGDLLIREEAQYVLDKLAAVSSEDVNRILEQQDDQWLTASEKDQITMFWESSTFSARISEISKGLTNGDYV